MRRWLVVLTGLAVLASPVFAPRAHARYSSGHSGHASSSFHGSGSRSGSSGFHYSSGKGARSSSSSSESSEGSGSGWATPHFGSAAARAQSREESRAQYGGSSPSSGGSTPSSGGSWRGGSSPPSSSLPPLPRDARDAQIADLRARLDATEAANRPSRLYGFFRGYYTHPAYVYAYHDDYNPWFWAWLLDQSLDAQSYWAYHHRYAMDSARYDWLMNQNAALQARVSQLEAARVDRDPTYVPPGLSSPDLMYTDQYVESAVTGTPVSSATYAPPPPPPPPPSSGWHVTEKVFGVVFVFGGCCALYWLVFVHRWSIL